MLSSLPGHVRLFRIGVFSMLLIACSERGSGPGAESARAPAALLLHSIVRQDTLTRMLIARQRMLLEAVIVRDSIVLESYLEPQYGWQLKQVISDPATGAERVRLAGRPLRFADLVSGVVPEELAPIPTYFEVTGVDTRMAVIEARWADREDKLITQWVNLGGTWKARRTDALVRP